MVRSKKSEAMEPKDFWLAKRLFFGDSTSEGIMRQHFGKKVPDYWARKVRQIVEKEWRKNDAPSID